jgi:Domain of unknown function (DUF2382)
MTAGYNNNSSQNNSSSEPSPPSPSSMSFTPTTLQTIPVVEEKPSISKESVASNTIIEKRWVTKTELVRVPVTYEEIYVNGKLMSSGGGGILCRKFFPLFMGMIRVSFISGILLLVFRAMALALA